MAIVTSSYRSLNARWLWSLANKKKSLFVGVSKISTEQTVTIDGKQITISNFDINDNDGNDAITKIDFFVRANIEFIKESNNTNWDIKLSTKQKYDDDPYKLVDKHNFQDKQEYWKYISPEYALSEGCYNLLLDFNIDDSEHKYGNLFKDIRHFYLFDELLYKNEEVSDSIDFIIKDDTDPDYSSNNFHVQNIIVIDDFIPFSIPDYFDSRIKYLISF